MKENQRKNALKGARIQLSRGFVNEEMIISSDQKSFLHISKNTKKVKVKSVDATIYKTKNVSDLYDGEEFDFFDYDIYIGTLDASSVTQCVGYADERNQHRRLESLFHQISLLDA